MKNVSDGAVVFGLISIVVLASVAQYLFGAPVDWLCVGIDC